MFCKMGTVGEDQSSLLYVCVCVRALETFPESAEVPLLLTVLRYDSCRWSIGVLQYYSSRITVVWLVVTISIVSGTLYGTTSSRHHTSCDIIVLVAVSSLLVSVIRDASEHKERNMTRVRRP